MPSILVIGATGVAGTAAIEAVREEFGNQTHVTGVWYGTGSSGTTVPGVNAGIEADVAAPDFIDTLRHKAGSSFDYLFFATAVGDVGFPVTEATPEQIERACRISFDPLVRLEAELSIGRSVGYSTFYTLPHQRVNYGAMGPTKEKLEKWVADETAGGRACIRAGAFASDSSRAIRLMLRRRARQLAESSNPLLRDVFQGRKPSEAVEELARIVQEEERNTYGDTGTSIENLREAHRVLLKSPSARFVNVCGKRIWISDRPELL